jgi:hypothetical protein
MGMAITNSLIPKMALPPCFATRPVEGVTKEAKSSLVGRKAAGVSCWHKGLREVYK